MRYYRGFCGLSVMCVFVTMILPYSRREPFRIISSFFSFRESEYGHRVVENSGIDHWFTFFIFISFMSLVYILSHWPKRLTAYLSVAISLGLTVGIIIIYAMYEDSASELLIGFNFLAGITALFLINNISNAYYIRKNRPGKKSILQKRPSRRNKELLDQ